MSFQCANCGHNECGVIENQTGTFTICKKCGYVIESQSEQQKQEQQLEYELNNSCVPKCPTCQSPNIKKISGGAKMLGALGFGLFSKTARSQFECLNCGYKF